MCGKLVFLRFESTSRCTCISSVRNNHYVIAAVHIENPYDFSSHSIAAFSIDVMGFRPYVRLEETTECI